MWNGEVNSREGGLFKVKERRKGDRDVEDSGERKGNQLRRITIEDGREGQREAGVGL